MPLTELPEETLCYIVGFLVPTHPVSTLALLCVRAFRTLTHERKQALDRRLRWATTCGLEHRKGLHTFNVTFASDCVAEGERHGGGFVCSPCQVSLRLSKWSFCLPSTFRGSVGVIDMCSTATWMVYLPDGRAATRAFNATFMANFPPDYPRIQCLCRVLPPYHGADLRYSITVQVKDGILSFHTPFSDYFVSTTFPERVRLSPCAILEGTHSRIGIKDLLPEWSTVF